MPPRSISRRLFYNVLHVVCRITAVGFFGIRCHRRSSMPESGPVLVCANHQSYLDPVLMGLTFDRRLNFLARKSLFRFGPFRWLINSLDAIPLEREGLGTAGLKESLRRLKGGELVLIFPEGTRTRDGSVSRLKPGFCALARRAGATLLPVGIDGAYDAWPRTAWIPRPTVIHICVGDPIGPELFRQMDDSSLVDELERRIRACHARAASGRIRSCRWIGDRRDGSSATE